MTISSRTPEGVPQRCPICGRAAATEPSYPGGDSCCPTCGSLLWWFRDYLSSPSLQLDSSFEDAGIDSMDTVELVMALEGEFDLAIPDEQAAEIHTIQDAIRYIQASKHE